MMMVQFVNLLHTDAFEKLQILEDVNEVNIEAYNILCLQ